MPIAVGNNSRANQGRTRWSATSPCLRGLLEVRPEYPINGIGHQPVCTPFLRDNHLTGRTAFDPGEYAGITFRTIDDDRCANVIIDSIEPKRSSHHTTVRLPVWLSKRSTVVSIGTVIGNGAICFVHSPVCYERRII
ncbi:MAG: hypothetical protein ACYTFQ_30110, partial [Planctomycetota bacterium]